MWGKNLTKHRACKESYVWNPSRCDCEIVAYFLHEK